LQATDIPVLDIITRPAAFAYYLRHDALPLVVMTSYLSSLKSISS
jgi:hypothetical protein